MRERMRWSEFKDPQEIERREAPYQRLSSQVGSLVYHHSYNLADIKTFLGCFIDVYC